MQCGLCKDIDNSKPYKIINSTECLSSIPDEAEEYNSKLKLLKCKSGYILNGNNCVPHCYPTCETCSTYSEDEESQNCISCNSSYYLVGEKCIKKIPTKIEDLINKINNIKTKEGEIKNYDSILKIVEDFYTSKNCDTFNIDNGKDEIIDIDKMKVILTT